MTSVYQKPWEWMTCGICLKICDRISRKNGILILREISFIAEPGNNLFKLIKLVQSK
jgi:hypothetical protein